MMRKCLSCGGTYAETLADGMEYYHACPPLSVPELKAALAAGTLDVAPLFQARIDAAAAADAKRLPGDATPLAVDTLLASITVPRHLARDENVTGPAPDDRSLAPIVAVGKGFVQLLDAGDPPIVATVRPGPPLPLTP